jgi:hypothetical protein
MWKRTLRLRSGQVGWALFKAAVGGMGLFLLMLFLMRLGWVG